MKVFQTVIVLGSSGNVFLDDVFRIQDNGDITKEIAFQSSSIATGTVRTITMPDADVDLSKVNTNEANPDLVSQAEAEAGTSTTERTWTALRVAQAIAALASGGSSIYGSNFHLFESAGVSTTTSTTFQTKITGTTGTLEAGTYKITISYSWNHDSLVDDFEARFLFGGVAVGEDSAGLIHKNEPKDDAGNNPVGTLSDQRYPYTKIFFVTGVTAGTKAVLLTYRTDTVSVSSSIWEASIEIIRVS